MKNVQLIAIASLLIATTGFSQAHAASRSCDAAYVLVNPNTGGTITFGGTRGSGNKRHFSAFGTCRSSKPNECRKRARTAASQCLQLHWNTRWERKRPEHCHPGKNVKHYNVTDLKTHLEKKACAQGWGQTSNIRLQLRAKTWGGTSHCTFNKYLSHYDITPAMCDNVGY